MTEFQPTPAFFTYRCPWCDTINEHEVSGDFKQENNYRVVQLKPVAVVACCLYVGGPDEPHNGELFVEQNGEDYDDPY